MDKFIRISDCLADIDLDEGLFPETELPAEVSLDRIRQLALDVTREKVELHEVPIKRKSGKRLWRSLLIAAALTIVASSVVAASMGGFGTFQKFFGRKASVAQVKVQNIGLSVVRSGVKMNIESAVSDGSSGLIMLTFERLDGTAFDKNVMLGEVIFDGFGKAGYVYEPYEQLTDNDTRLLCYVYVRPLSGYMPSDLSMNVVNINSEVRETRYLNVNLRDLADVKFKDIQLLPDVFPNYLLTKVQTSEDKLFLYTSFQSNGPRANTSGANPNYLSQTEPVIYLQDCRTCNVLKGQMGDPMLFDMCDVDSMADVRPIVFYSKRSVSIPGQWEASFTLKPNEDKIVSMTNVDVLDKKVDFTISKLTVSLLGVQVEVNTKNGNYLYQHMNDILYALSRNASYVQLQNGGMQGLSLLNSSISPDNDSKLILNYTYENDSAAPNMVKIIEDFLYKERAMSIVNKEDISRVIVNGINFDIQK